MKKKFILAALALAIFGFGAAYVGVTTTHAAANTGNSSKDAETNDDGASQSNKSNDGENPND